MRAYKIRAYLKIYPKDGLYDLLITSDDVLFGVEGLSEHELDDVVMNFRKEYGDYEIIQVTRPTVH